MSKISEFFGLYCKNSALDFRQAMELQTCPYTQRICTKMRKSDPEMKIGTHEPGNELYLVPEVQLPGGYVDYFLVSVKDKKVRDFIGIELQAMDTTGTIWPERQKFLNEQGIRVSPEDLNHKKLLG